MPRQNKRKEMAQPSGGRQKRRTTQPSRFRSTDQTVDRCEEERGSKEPSIALPPEMPTRPLIAHGESAFLFNEVDAIDVVPLPPVQMASTFDGIGIHVPQKIRQKIWDGEYVALGILGKSSQDMETSQGELVFEGGKIMVRKQIQGGSFTSIEAWSSIFMNFMSVLLEHSPQEVQQLLKYMRDIRLLAGRSSSWPWYDEQFRIKKANSYTSVGNVWDVIPLFSVDYKTQNYVP